MLHSYMVDSTTDQRLLDKCRARMRAVWRLDPLLAYHRLEHVTMVTWPKYTPFDMRL